MQGTKLLAEKAFGIDKLIAQFIKLRAEIRKSPQQALARLDTLERVANNPESERMVHAWRGLTYDKLQQYDKAARADTSEMRDSLQRIEAHLRGDTA